MRFDQKVAFITGGAIGFGRAFGRALAQEGAAIAIADIDGDAAERTAKEFESAGFRAVALTCDVAAEDDVAGAVEATVRELGGVDILINNAGKHLTKYNQPFSVLPRHELRALFDVNVIGVVNCTIACRDTMAGRGGGVVVNIASIAGHLHASPYAVSKLAVRGLTVALAAELAPDGIRVNAISPGLMATENAMDDLPTAMVEDFIQNRQLIHRLGTMDDIVKTMLFLCSDDASFVTGETIKVSGGYPAEL
jgi:NAD(P)-dependent dehydrogenase (short-subunit alcohol dehydrogenase family)